MRKCFSKEGSVMFFLDIFVTIWESLVSKVREHVFIIYFISPTPLNITQLIRFKNLLEQ